MVRQIIQGQNLATTTARLLFSFVEASAPLGSFWWGC